METRTKLLERQSGSVDVVWNGSFTRVEFNLDCLDALPMCHGQCCRGRIGFSVELEPDELGHYESRPHPMNKYIRLLQVKESTRSCVYLDEESSLCTIHEHRPKMCRRWHCSSRGQLSDPSIDVRDVGWILEPMRKEELEFIETQKVGQ